MRILMVVNSLGVGGLQTVVRSLAEEMANRGHAMRILCLTGEARNSVPVTDVEVEFVNLPNVKVHNVHRAVAATTRCIRDFRPDVVHSHAFHPNSVSTISCSILRAPHLIRTIHSIQEGGRVHGAISRHMYALPGTNTAVSKRAARSVPLTLAPKVIHNGIDTARFAFSDERRAAGRAALGARQDETIVISVGRLVPAKDFNNLVTAVSLSAGELRDRCCRFVIVGEGPLRGELERRIEDLDVSDLLSLPGGSSRVPELLAGADAYVQCSAWEGLPIAPLEAIASGLPVCATLAGGTDEIRPPLFRYVAPRNSRALALGLIDLVAAVRTPAERAALAATQLPFDLRLWADRWEDVYRQALR